MLLLLIGIITCQSLVAQNSRTRIFINTLRPLGVSHPDWNMGLERDTWERQSIAVEVGVFERNWSLRRDMKGNRVNLEYKFFQKDAPTYIAVGGQWGNPTYEAINIFINRDGSELRAYGVESDIPFVYEDTIQVNKDFFDVYGLLGYRVETKASVYADFFCGLGLRYKRVAHSGRKRAYDEMGPSGTNTERDRAGRSFSPILRAGFILGLYF